MRILIDTNVLLDFLSQREPFYTPAKKIISLCTEESIEGCVAAHSITNAFYILRKEFSLSERRKMLIRLCEMFVVVGIDKHKLMSALSNLEFEDMEDCLQYECAECVNADYIVTRNVKDFALSGIP
ncbi:MAG: PIN domain-containing protein, partial [Oscillospiraceae bacterium]|nr:PIN domain-containing protein [Oscillospiraceae bacterium]